jgi:hypothetical protein
MKASTSFSTSSVCAPSLGNCSRSCSATVSPLLARCLGGLLNEERTNGRAYFAPLSLAGVHQSVVHKVHPAALPGGLQDLGGGRLDTFMDR